MTMIIKLAETDAEVERLAPVLLQLRPAFNQTGLIAQAHEQHQDGYRLAYVASEGGAVLCVAGFRIGQNLGWGRHIYVDDLVTDAAHRSTGAGARMIRWLKSFARSNGCQQIHLDSSVQRFAAHRFYLREGFNIASHHFSIIDLQDQIDPA